MRCVSAEERAKRFKEDLYPDGGVPFCRFCEHSVDFVRVDTIKDHLKSISMCPIKKVRQVKKEHPVELAELVDKLLSPQC